MDHDHMTLDDDHVTTEPTNEQPDQDGPVEAMDTDAAVMTIPDHHGDEMTATFPDHHDNHGQEVVAEMIESATMRDVMEKCGSVERDEFVPDFEVNNRMICVYLFFT